MALYSNIFNFSHLFQFDKFSLDLSVLTKLEILESIFDSFKSFIFDAFFNLLIIDALVELNLYGFLGVIIGGFLLITVILIIGPRILESKPIKIKLETVTNTNFDINSVNSLINSLGLQNMFQSNLFSFTESFNSNSILLQSNNHQSNSKVLLALDQQYPNWKDSIINSPLEENIIPHIINVLSNNLYLHFIILYLLIMLLIIITCKYILKDNIEFTKIQNNPLGA